MCHSIVGSKTYMAPEVISPQVDDYGREIGYDGAKVGGRARTGVLIGVAGRRLGSESVRRQPGR